MINVRYTIKAVSKPQSHLMACALPPNIANVHRQNHEVTNRKYFVCLYKCLREYKLRTYLLLRHVNHG